MKKWLVALCLLVLFFAACSSERQFLDAGWTQKPAKMKILFTKPSLVVEDKEFRSTDPAYAKTMDMVLGWFNKQNDEVEIPEAMEVISDWFRDKIDNVMQFNSNVPSVVERVSKKKISRDTENMDGVDVKIPKLEAMSDSFDVYLILDEIGMHISKVDTYMSTGPSFGPTGLPTTPGVGLRFQGESTRIDANYAAYDVKTGKRLAYGHLEDGMYHEDVAAETGWYDNLRQLMLRILGSTPVTRFN